MRVATAPLAELTLARRGREARGWLGSDGAVVLVSRGADVLEPAAVTTRFLPDLVARLVELGPGAGPADAAVELNPGTLAEAIASGRSSLGSALPPVQDYWSLELQTLGEAPIDPLRLEVARAGGWWRIEPQGTVVRLLPASAREIWRRLTRMVREAAPDARPRSAGGVEGA
jgi:hypothetical protein